MKYSEFYTRFEDVVSELSFYENQLKNKVIYCNCDVPERSAFWRYFHLNFKRLGLKKLIATYYNREGHSFAFSYWGGNDADVSCCSFWELEGNGDFRSDECIELLNASDIIASLLLITPTIIFIINRNILPAIPSILTLLASLYLFTLSPCLH